MPTGARRPAAEVPLGSPWKKKLFETFGNSGAVFEEVSGLNWRSWEAAQAPAFRAVLGPGFRAPLPSQPVNPTKIMSIPGRLSAFWSAS